MKKNISILCGAIVSFGMLLGLGVSLNQNETKQVKAEEETSYTLVTDVSSLKSGDVVVIGCSTKATAASTQGKDFLERVSGTFDSGTLTISGATEFTLGTSSSSWTFSNSNKLLGSSGAKKLFLDGAEMTTTWSISIDKGVTKISSTNTGYGTILYNVSATRFTTYISNPSDAMICAELFVKDTGPAPEVTSISVKTAPTKTVYEVGDTFNPNGLVITANYSSGNPRDIAYEGNENKFTFVPSLTTSLSATDTNVVITYSEKTCSQAITVNAPKVLEDVSISGKATAIVGGSWDLSNLVVTGIFDDTTTADITDKCILSSNDSTSTAGSKTITVHVSYKNGEKTFDKSGVNAEVKEADVFTLVTSESQLEAGSKIIFATEYTDTDSKITATYLMGAYETGNNVKAIGTVTVSNNSIALTEQQSAAIYTLNETDEGYTFKDVNDLYLYAAGSKKDDGKYNNYLKAQQEIVDNSYWNIDPNAEKFVVTSINNKDVDVMCFNYNKANGQAPQPLFSCYNSGKTGQPTVKVYVKGGSPVPPPSEDVLQSLTITGAKNSFNEGEAFTLGTSAVIKANYSVSGEKTLAETDLIYKIDNKDVSVGDPISADLNSKTVVATYVDDDNQRASAAGYTITVTARTLESIQVSASSTVKKAYVVGEKFNPNGLVLTLKYNVGEDGSASYSETSKANFTFIPNLETSLTKENTSVTIGFGGKTCDLAITVTDTPAPSRTLTEVVIKVNPTKMVYKVGEKFDPTGMMVQAKFSDDTTQCPVDYSTDAPDTFTEEKESFPITITVEIDGVTKTATLNVKVSNNAGHLGCGGSVIAASGIVFVSAIAGCIFLAKRKKQD